MKTSARRSKSSVYDHLSRVGRAVAAPKRLEILDVLAQAPRTVEVLTELANGLTIANTSRHLSVLHRAGLVVRQKKGLYVEYRLADDSVAELYAALRSLATRRLPAMETFRDAFSNERGALEPMSGEELSKRLAAGDVTVLDARPVEEFNAAHIAGARSIPIADLEERLSELPRRRTIVAYSRGPYCTLAIRAVELLRDNGFVAHRFDGGIIEWRSLGGAIERAP